MLIDTHAHLNFKSFKKDIDEVIKRAKKAGVDRIILPGAKIESSIKAIEIARLYKLCYAAVGILPHHIKEINNSKVYEDELLKLTKQNKVIAVGEVGLDYHQYKNDSLISQSDKKIQTKMLLAQLIIAIKAKLPVIIHCREAYDDLVKICISIKQKQKNLQGVFHCFEGEKKHLTIALNLGFYIGLNGKITYSENRELRNLIKFIPLNRLLLETDSPFLTPIPLRGQRNEPAHLTYIAAEVARIKNENLLDIAKITSANALKLFSIM